MKNTNQQAFKFCNTSILFLLCFLFISSCSEGRRIRSESNKYKDDTLLVTAKEIKIIDSNVTNIIDSLIFRFNFCRQDKGKLQVYIVINDIGGRIGVTGQAFDIYITNNADLPKPTVSKKEYYGGMMYKNAYILYNSHFITNDYSESFNHNYKWYELTGVPITIPLYNRTIPWGNHNKIEEGYDIINGKFNFLRRVPCNEWFYKVKRSVHRKSRRSSLRCE